MHVNARSSNHDPNHVLDRDPKHLLERDSSPCEHSQSLVVLKEMPYRNKINHKNVHDMEDFSASYMTYDFFFLHRKRINHSSWLLLYLYHLPIVLTWSETVIYFIFLLHDHQNGKCCKILSVVWDIPIWNRPLSFLISIPVFAFIMASNFID